MNTTQDHDTASQLASFRLSRLNSFVRATNKWLTFCAAYSDLIVAGDRVAADALKRPSMPGKNRKYRAYDDAAALQYILRPYGMPQDHVSTLGGLARVAKDAKLYMV